MMRPLQFDAEPFQAYTGDPELHGDLDAGEWNLEAQAPEGEQHATPATHAGQVPTPNIPELIKREETPPGVTLYARISLGAEKPARSMTGIFVPEAFGLTPRVDVILYLHGIKPRADLTIDRYWSTRYYRYWPVREGLNEARKNAVLVAPTLGPRSQTQTGWLTKPGGLDVYLNQIAAALTAHGPYRQTNQRPRIGNIVLACHSGGGLPMRQLALAENRCAGQIKECWGFDCLYFTGDETLWPSWAAAHPDARLYVHYLGSTAARSLKLKKKNVPNIFVARSTAKGHNWVPIEHWQERLRGAAFLGPARRTDRSGAIKQGLAYPASLFIPRHGIISAEREDYELEENEYYAADLEAEADLDRTDFRPVAVESPGGDRIQDKREPPKGDLVKVVGYGGRKRPLHRLAAQALAALIETARAEGVPEPLLHLVSGYRSVAEQKRLWEIGLKKHGSEKEARKWIAKPGSSPHHSGRAVDLWMGLGIGKRNAEKMRAGKAFKWMQQNAARFGFYPYEAEPWHWEYNPPAGGKLKMAQGSYLEMENEAGYE